MHISNWRFVEQIPETLVALLLLAMQMIKGPHALQFHTGAVRKSRHHRQHQRVAKHLDAIRAAFDEARLEVRARRRRFEVACFALCRAGIHRMVTKSLG
jgi:hypothetical protein